MSTFQHYQFKPTDRPFTEREREEIDAWSSRTSPSATAATYTFTYSDFQRKEEELLEKYFDAILSVATWGAKRLLFRLPKDLIKEQNLSAYIFEDDDSENSIAVHTCESCYLLEMNFSAEDEPSRKKDNNIDLNDLLPIREDILQGDNRALYLLWLQFAQHAKVAREESDENTEGETKYFPPPVPANLAKLSGTSKALIEFFEIEEEIIKVAKASS